MSDDIEGNLRTVYTKGNAPHVKFTASDRDKSTAIYRRFDELSARSRLYLESELAELEERQRQFNKDDENSTQEEKKSTRNQLNFKNRAGIATRKKKRG